MYTSESNSDYVEWKLMSKKQLDKTNRDNTNNFKWDKYQFSLTFGDDDDNDAVDDGNRTNKIHHSKSDWKQLSPPDNLMHSFFRVRTIGT